MAVVEWDRQKRVVSRTLVEQANGLQMELVEFEVVADREHMFGCRVWSERNGRVYHSRITDLYDNPGEPVTVARAFKIAV